MDTLLIAVTALSLLMAAAMAIVVMKLLRDERRRSDARVAMLSGWATEDAPTHRESASASPTPARASRLRPEASAADLPLRLTTLAPDPSRESDARLPIAGDLFVEPEQSSPWGRRFGVIAAMAAVLITTGFLLFRGADPVGTETRGGAVSPAAKPAPLALLSLRHAQEPDRLTITGLVQNPRGAAPLTHVVATAFAFAADGTFLASGRAPLDFTALGGGDESPFVVNIPVNGSVARYRVGFRTEDGRVLAHVDKRSDTIAQR